MRTDVTEKGVFIPKHLFRGATKVEIHSENSVIVVVPVVDEDPVFSLGKNPVSDEAVTDASVNHDKYLYDSK